MFGRSDKRIFRFASSLNFLGRTASSTLPPQQKPKREKPDVTCWHPREFCTNISHEARIIFSWGGVQKFYFFDIYFMSQK